MEVLADFYNEQGVFLSQKVKNLIKKANPDHHYVFNLTNVIVNGQKRGCTGFITNPDNGSCVYITTEYCAAGHFMYRYADGIKDYKGYTNRWDGKNDFQKFGKCIVEALKKTPQEAGDKRI